MTQEDKKLLLKDLCARLPYRVKCRIKGERSKILIGIVSESLVFKGRTPNKSDWCYNYYDIEEWSILPYLRPMSSMTEKEKHELYNSCNIISLDFERRTTDIVAIFNSAKVIDYFNAHHFDYRGLIEKGLAIDCTGLNVY